jgi:apolipoprotein N-acyltransferase
MTGVYGLSPVFAVLATLFSGILLFAAFPSYNFSLLAWVALLPLLLVLTRNKPLHSFFLSFFFGVVFYTGFFYWIFDLPKYNILHHTILGVYLCPLLGIFGWLISFTTKRAGVAAALFLAPFAWITQEYIRSNLYFLSLPWGLLAHSQYESPLIIQIAGSTGTYGLSFLIVLVNSGLTALLYPLFIINKPHHQTAISKRGKISVVSTAATLLLLNLLYGYFETIRPIQGEEIKVGLVQGNIEQSRKWDEKYAPVIMQIYADLTQRISKEKPTLIVWPETATPRAINHDPKLYDQVRHIAKSANTHLLVGSSQLQKFKLKNGKPQEVKYTNSAYLISPGVAKKKDPRYDKIRLLPFGEYLPHRENIPWSYLHVPDVNHFLAGKKYVVFKLPQFNFAVTICWENLFPEMVRQFVQHGAQVIINITNEAWFGETAAPYQFLSMSVFRAVENSIYVIRCANTGISCFIDPFGRIVNRITDAQGKDISVRGILTESVFHRKTVTFYNRYGDWFAWLCIFITLISILLAIFKKRPTSVHP